MKPATLTARERQPEVTTEASAVTYSTHFFGGGRLIENPPAPAAAHINLAAGLHHLKSIGLLLKLASKSADGVSPATLADALEDIGGLVNMIADSMFDPLEALKEKGGN